jgi:hypothetical protein
MERLFVLQDIGYCVEGDRAMSLQYRLDDGHKTFINLGRQKSSWPPGHL